jgi:hypothetical protein
MWHGRYSMRLRAPLVALVFGVSFGSTGSQSAPIPPTTCPADATLADLVAGSDLVLVGRMDVPKQRLLEESTKPSPDYLEIPIQIGGVVKGANVENATVRFYPRDAAYKPSNDSVLHLAGTPAILFLTRVDDGPVGLYFAGYSPDALKPATDQNLEAAREEVSRQAKIINSWRVDTTLPRFGEVRALIARLGRVSGDEQQHVFDQLERLGEEAVPAIISQMDDRRPLQTQAISLVNHAKDAFEGMRHYGPKQVVDGLDAVLNQITGESFGSITNGGSDRQRAATVAGWRVYAADLACKAAR